MPSLMVLNVNVAQQESKFLGSVVGYVRFLVLVFPYIFNRLL